MMETCNPHDLLPSLWNVKVGGLPEELKSLYKILDEDALRKETVFGCQVSIPGTSYRITEETMYFPGKGKGA